MSELILQVVFWGSAGLMVFTFFGYPLTLRFLRKRYAIPPQVNESDLPRVAIMIPAYNEEAVIERKVRNCLEQDYPADKLEILVGSDGSKDLTDEIVSSIPDPRVKLIRLGGRNGKPLVLNQLYETAADADVVVISDANILWDKQALKMACRHFSDPTVGVVSAGRYAQSERSDELALEEQSYTAHENKLKTLESQVGGMSGGLGMLLAIRRELYRPFPPGSANDDTTPMIWAVLSGLRAVWDMESKAYERSGQSFREEFRRRIRIGVGNYQTLFRYAEVLSPRHGIAAYTFFSHKVIRWLFPFLMIAALLANSLLASNPFYGYLLAGQLALYGMTMIGFVLVALHLRVPPFTSLFHFVAMNVALFWGFFRYLKQGNRRFVWEPTART
ncbi:MAG: glycosyltransferase [Calditrichaeota bacterium]|nr:glycosyltransferase [Calditrichota bacterium]